MPIAQFTNHKIFYDDFGRGPVILFIHPPGMGRKTFVKQIPLEKSCRIIIPDLSGHGDSPCPDEKISVQTYVNEVEAIRKHLNIDCIFLFGYSAGGVIVQEYAIQFPNNVKGVILSGGYPKVDTEILKNEHLIGIYFVEHFPKVLAKIIAASHFHEKNLQYEMYEHILKSNQNIWAEFYRQSLYYDCLNRIDQLISPLMLLYGTRSDFINHHVRLYPKIMDTEIHFISAVGHQLPTKKYQEVNQLIQQFVQRIVSSYQ